MSAFSHPQSHDAPPPPPPPDVTALLLSWGAGVSATALVHEAYLRLVDQTRVRVESLAHFQGIAARVMRQILVDHARARGAAKRGGREGDAVLPVTLRDGSAVASQPGDEVLAVHEALERLAALDPEQARLVELRYFAGLTIAETAVALGVSPATANREWAAASAWLRRELEDHSA